MTKVVISFDTELSLLRHQQGTPPRANFESSILGRCDAGDFGIGWQMDILDRHGLNGVFFVDPFPALVYGGQIVADIISPIFARGHEVQLHIHTEWLEWVEDSPVGGRKGQSLADFDSADQLTLLRLACDLLVAAGATTPIAFRAGNYGANDASLAALAALGLRYDSSFNPAYSGNTCAISLAPDQILPSPHHGVIELPISGIFDRPGAFRPAQVCAMSSTEMRRALDHAAREEQSVFSIVCHSFEMLSRDRQRPNRLVMARFEQLCRHVADHPDLDTTTIAALDQSGSAITPLANATRLPASRLRTLTRIAQQAVGTWLYDRQLRPV